MWLVFVTVSIVVLYFLPPCCPCCCSIKRCGAPAELQIQTECSEAELNVYVSR